MPLPPKGPQRKGKKPLGKPTMIRKFERYSRNWWIMQIERFKKNNLYAWGIQTSAQILRARTRKRKDELSLAVEEKLMDLAKRKKGPSINAVVSGFVFSGADDAIISILIKARLFSWTGHVFQNRGKYFDAGLMYFRARDKRNLKRLIEKLQVKEDAVSKENVAGLKTHLGTLEKGRKPK